MDPQSPINDQERQEDNMSPTTNPNPDQEMPATTSPVINPQTSTLDSESPTCGICLEVLSTDSVRLMPCQHEFHLECIRQFYDFSGSTHHHCPLGRYDFQGNGRFIKKTTTRTEDITPAQQERILQLKQLQTTRIDIDIDFTLISPLFWDVEDDHIVKVSRELTLWVRQGAGRTCSGVSRRLRVKHLPKGTGAALGFRTTHRPEEVGKAKSELQAVLGNFSLENQWQKVKLVRPKVRADEMELKVWAQTMVRVEKMKDSTLDAERDTNVLEEYMLHAGERESQGEETVRLAREEIGGALDTMRIIYGEAFEGLQWPGKEGVELEDWKGCEHCGKKERNGDCLYPRDMLDQLADGTIDLTEARAQVNGWTAAKYYNQAW